MGRACSTRRKDEKSVRIFSRKTLQEETTWKGVNTKVIMKCILKKQDVGVGTGLIWLTMGTNDGLS